MHDRAYQKFRLPFPYPFRGVEVLYGKRDFPAAVEAAYDHVGQCARTSGAKRLYAIASSGRLSMDYFFAPLLQSLTAPWMFDSLPSFPADVFLFHPLQNQHKNDIVQCGRSLTRHSAARNHIRFARTVSVLMTSNAAVDTDGILKSNHCRVGNISGVNQQAPHAAKKQRMNIPLLPIPAGDNGNSLIEAVRSRIEYKMRDYAIYNFTPPQSSAINIFFDLAQEFENIAQLHTLSVLILRMFFNYKAELFLKDEHTDLTLVTPPVTDEVHEPPQLRPAVWNDNTQYHFPVRGRNSLVLSKTECVLTDENIMGMLVLYVDAPLESHDVLFLKKFANRLGFCLHNKLLAERNSRHILFLRKLAHDIGHNIITPNLRLKFQFHQLKGQLDSLKDICGNPADEATIQDVRILQRKMDEQLKTIIGNFQNSALFLESLLRQSHFDLGHYVLRRSRLNIADMVVAPQLERYRPHFEERGIPMRHAQPSYPPTPCVVQADLGLISQVMANFLSNAVKYCTPTGKDGQCDVHCTVEVLPDAFENTVAGVKVSVFSSGPHIPPDEAALLFDDHYRASNASGQYGTGHGLFFVREIIAEHAGKTGYEPLPGGNNFYFMLPLAE